MKSVRELIYEVAEAILDTDGSLNPRTPWTGLVGDSADVVALVMGIEEGFEVSFDNQEIAALGCLEDLVRAVEGKLGDDPACGVRHSK